MLHIRQNCLVDFLHSSTERHTSLCVFLSMSKCPWTVLSQSSQSEIKHCDFPKSFPSGPHLLSLSKWHSSHFSSAPMVSKVWLVWLSVHQCNAAHFTSLWNKTCRTVIRYWASVGFYFILLLLKLRTTNSTTFPQCKQVKYWQRVLSQHLCKAMGEE